MVGIALLDLLQGEFEMFGAPVGFCVGTVVIWLVGIDGWGSWGAWRYGDGSSPS